MLNAGQLNDRFSGAPRSANSADVAAAVADLRFASGPAEPLTRASRVATRTPAVAPYDGSAALVLPGNGALAAPASAGGDTGALRRAPAHGSTRARAIAFQQPAQPWLTRAAAPNVCVAAPNEGAPATPRLLAPSFPDRGVMDRQHAARPLLDHMAKRTFDVTFALCFLLVAAPVLILLAIALKLDSPGALFFVQQRVGRGGRMFGCIKLRTMRVDADTVLAHLLATCPTSRAEWAADHKLRNDPRVSRLGRVLRKLSLDELPQLFNILRGEMSVVGPRPIVQAEVVRYGPAFADYCAVKPGLTGLWQVSGRNDVSYADRVAMDREYRHRASFAFDLGIVLRTVPAVLGAHGSY
jgi:exopolysaccharide production protein ExoY